MVTEACAAEVIASYMEKSEIEELSKAPELPLEQLLAHSKSTTTASVRAPAEPVTLMPQVLIEHKPLQQSRWDHLPTNNILINYTGHLMW